MFLLSLALLWRLDWFHHRSSSSRGRAKRSTLHRLLSPRCSDDGPACRLDSTPSSGGGPADVASLVRGQKPARSPQASGHRGLRLSQPKVLLLWHHRCTHPCGFFGDGKHGPASRIQTFRGPACRTTFSARRHTPLSRLKTPWRQIAVVLAALAEGLDPSAAERVAGLPTSHHHEPFCPVLLSRLRRCTSARSAPSGSRICRWMNCAPGCVAPHRCVFLWLAIDPWTRASSCAPSVSPHAAHGAPGHPLPARDLGRLSASPFSPAMG